MWRSWLPLLAVAGTLAAACGSPPGPVSAPSSPGPAPSPAGTPASNQPPRVTVEDATAHEGFEAAVTVNIEDPGSAGWTAYVHWGDGTDPQPVFAGSVPGFVATHRYLRDGAFRVRVAAKDGHGAQGFGESTVLVIPRRVLFVQGFGSSSTCDGRGFLPRVPPVLGALPAADVAQTLRVGATDFLYFSYSGRYCEGDGSGGETADYNSDHTCAGIDDPGGAAEHLRSLIDAVAPSRVTILAHSMGGLAVAYLAGSDPAWAQEHIASVVTFDSPLRGVPQVNLALLRIGGDCSFNSRSIRDLSDRNGELLRIAGQAASVVPFYNLDATNREGPLVGIREAVPSDRTHLEGEAGNWPVATSHNALWRAMDNASVAAVVRCALALTPGERCPQPDDT